MDILLIEGNQGDAALTLSALRKQHLSNHIHLAQDGRSGLELAQANKEIGLILLDLMLPTMSSFEVLQHLEENIETREIPVIILTASMESPSIGEGFHLGAQGFIAKPVDFTKLIEATSALGFRWRLSDTATLAPGSR